MSTYQNHGHFQPRGHYYSRQWEGSFFEEINGEKILWEFWNYMTEEESSLKKDIGSDVIVKLNPLIFQKVDVILFCYSIGDRSTYESIWYPEVQYYKPEAITFLVGTKSDLRKREEFCQVSIEEGKKLADDIGCINYTEVSAKTGANMELLLLKIQESCREHIRKIQNNHTRKKTKETNCRLI